jgi:hypothetical protein
MEFLANRKKCLIQENADSKKLTAVPSDSARIYKRDKDMTHFHAIQNQKLKKPVINTRENLF